MDSQDIWKNIKTCQNEGAYVSKWWIQAVGTKNILRKETQGFPEVGEGGMMEFELEIEEESK